MVKSRLTVLYGSQTGTAQDYAEEIWRESKKFGFGGPVQAMDEYSIGRLINEKLVIFVCSTTGQGEEPDNMKLFWKFLLRRTLPSDSLSDMYFAVLGLGDSSYPKFNYTAKRLHKRLLQLSARPIIPPGLCDDQHDMGPSFVYLKWISELWSCLSRMYHINDEHVVGDNFAFKWNVEIARQVSNVVDMEPLLRPTDSEIYKIKLLFNTRITEEDHFQDVRLLSFSCENLTWAPGYVLVVKPWNSDEAVNEVFNIFEEQGLNFNRKTMVGFKKADEEMILPSYFTQTLPLEHVAKYLWDLNAVPRPSFFKLLAYNCDNELEKEKLIEFSTPEGLEDMLKYAVRAKRKIIEVLRDFPHAVSKLTLEALFEIFPIIKSRSFSIASVPECGCLQLLVAVVEYKTILKKPRKGLCSNWLKVMKEGEEILVHIKPGTMKITEDENVPLIMVGPGTGVAPFRSILLQRELSQKFIPGNLILFFGCRNQNKDFHCKEDWYRMMDKGMLRCFFAFSRDQENKRYVQHLIEEQVDFIRHLIDNNGTILVAGNSKNMPNNVREAFSKVLGGMNCIEKLIKELRYQEETW